MSTFTNAKPILHASRILSWSLFGGWCSLGFVRGLNAYDYDYKKYPTHDNSYLYSKKGLFGIAGLCLYINPILIWLTIPKEIYRLEINLRDLEDEKKGDFYNQLI
jgi:hypothetical protein